MKRIVSYLVLFIFLAQIAFMSYRIPQIILTGSSFPKEIKLSAIIAGFCLGILYMLKDYNSPFKK